MQIESSTLRLAVLKIFMDGRQSGGWHAYGDIAAAWHHTGLRGSDLRDAVHEMMEGGELRSAEREGVLSLALSPEVLQSMLLPNAYLRLGTLQDEVTLLGALFRVGGVDAGLRRRVVDEVEQFEEE
jgi:hypothetical protein